MTFYNRQHKFYCGIDLHATKMYVCIVDGQGETVVHKNIKAKAKPLTKSSSRSSEKTSSSPSNQPSTGTGWRTTAKTNQSPSFWATPWP